MLVSFSVQNYKVFERAELTLKAEPYGHLPNHVLNNGLLKGCMIFGYNGAGKSNLISGLKLLKEYALGSGEIPSGVFLNTWNSKATMDAPVSLELEVLLEENNQEYRYRYSVKIILMKKMAGYQSSKDANYRALEEKVIRIDENKSTVVYERYESGSLLMELRNKNPDVKRILDWMKNDLIILGINDSYLPDVSYHSISNLSEVVSCMDVGIESVSYGFENKMDIVPDIDQMRIRHSNGWESDLSKESEGTRRIIKLGSLLIPESNGKTFVVDELNRKLHPDLTRRFIELFFTNPNDNKQLIFTTHETRLLDDWLFRRDETWVVSRLKPDDRLAECKRIPNTNNKSMWELLSEMNKDQ